MKLYHLEQRGDDSWRVTISTGWDPVKKQYGKYRETFHAGSKTEADQRALVIANKVLQGDTVDPKRMTVAQFLERWLEEHVSGLSYKTRQFYTQIARNHIIPRLGTVHVKKLTPLTIQNYLRSITKLRAVKTDNGIELQDTGAPPAPDTVNAHYRTLKAAFGCAVKWGILTHNPTDGVTPPRRVKSAGHPLDPEQAATLLDAAEKHGIYAICFTAVTSGLREGELLALRWSDVDLERGIIKVSRTIIKGGRHPVFGRVKTDTGFRHVRMTPSLVKVLKDHRQEQRKVRLAKGEKWQDYDLVFPTSVGTPMTPRNFYRKFEVVREAAGLPKHYNAAGLPKCHTVHDLRHTNATLLIASGVPIKTVSARLGHSSTAFTQDRYGHVLQQMEDQAAAAMEAIIPDRRTPGVAKQSSV